MGSPGGNRGSRTSRSTSSSTTPGPTRSRSGWSTSAQRRTTRSSGRCATSTSTSTSGETVGLLGHNGSGKSTLLKCVAGILRPTTGRSSSTGRIAALLELGAGFHPDLTGRENIYLNASILGFSPQGDRPDLRRHRRVRRARGVHRQAGEALLVGHVRAARLRGRGQRRARDPARRRGAGGRRRGVPAQVPRADQAASSARAARSCSSPTPPTSCARSATGPRCSTTATSSRSARPARRRSPTASTSARKGAEVPEGLDDPTLLRNLEIEITAARIVYPDPNRRHLYPSEPLAVQVDFVAARRVSDVVFSIAIYDQDGKMLLGTNSDLMGDDPGSVTGEGDLHVRVRAVPGARRRLQRRHRHPLPRRRHDLRPARARKTPSRSSVRDATSVSCTSRCTPTSTRVHRRPRAEPEAADGHRRPPPPAYPAPFGLAALRRERARRGPLRRRRAGVDRHGHHRPPAHGGRVRRLLGHLLAARDRRLHRRPAHLAHRPRRRPRGRRHRGRGHVVGSYTGLRLVIGLVSYVVAIIVVLIGAATGDYRGRSSWVRRWAASTSSSSRWPTGSS